MRYTLSKKGRIAAGIGCAGLIISIFLTMSSAAMKSNKQKSVSDDKDKHLVLTSMPKEFRSSTAGELPNFVVIKDVKLKKKAFFDFLHPMVKQENKRILSQRDRIITLQNKSNISTEDAIYLLETAKSYKIKGIEEWENTHFNTLLSRVDLVPASLTLAQAANESAWGTSRFAREANNLFGQWCFSKGCGVTPKSRDEGKTHEIAKFASVNNSVVAYIRNINTGVAYEQLREIRKEFRQEEKPISGEKLASGLIKYSERGEEYVKEIQSMIRVNNLGNYNTLALNSQK